MPEPPAMSLRTRLLAWYVGTTMLVVAMVAVAVCWVIWQGRLAAIDAELRARIDAIASAVRPGVGGAFDVELPSDTTAFFQRARPRTYYAVWSGDQLVDRSDPDVAVPSVPPGRARTRGNSREVVGQADGLTILIGRDIDDVRAELWSLAGAMGLAGAGAMAASLLCAWLVAGRALAPVQRISETARRMADGELTARIAVDRTETELGQVACVLNVAFDRLHEAAERQRRFTADASHELRTPVAMLAAEVDWALMRERPEADYREALETCRRVAGRMRRLVEGLLTLARADSGDLAMRREPVHLDELVEDTVESMRQLAMDRRVALRLSASPAMVEGDSDRIVQLVGNLLANAIAYTDPGGNVRVDLRVKSREAVLRVADNGIGIDADDLPRIFDRFHRGGVARTREPAGSGLGLAVANWIVAAHAGSIGCVSEPGRGTTFTVRLPGQPAHPRAAGPVLAGPTTTPAAGT